MVGQDVGTSASASSVGLVISIAGPARCCTSKPNPPLFDGFTETCARLYQLPDHVSIQRYHHRRANIVARPAPATTWVTGARYTTQGRPDRLGTWCSSRGQPHVQTYLGVTVTAGRQVLTSTSLYGRDAIPPALD